jgi:hypothetical protein
LKNIKFYISILGFIIFYTSCGNAIKKVNRVPNSSNQSSDSDYVYHFGVLDSAAAVTEYDTIVLCCRGNISFMERTTKIPASSSGTFAGKLSFTKRDLQRWHEWYKRKYER